MDDATQRGWPAFPETAWDPAADADPYRVNGLPAIAERRNAVMHEFAAPHSLALGALVDAEVMAEWATATESAYPAVRGP